MTHAYTRAMFEGSVATQRLNDLLQGPDTAERLREARIQQMVNEPWRISEIVFGTAAWPWEENGKTWEPEDVLAKCQGLQDGLPRNAPETAGSLSPVPNPRDVSKLQKLLLAEAALERLIDEPDAEEIAEANWERERDIADAGRPRDA